jgi:hypothetical protein
VIKRGVTILGWLVIGHAATFGLYWALLQVPESNVLMLGTSLLLVLGMMWWFGLVQAVGLLAWKTGSGLRASLGPASRRAWLVIIPLVLFAFVWWMTGLASGWLDRHWSEIDAWILLKTGWTKAAVVRAGCEHVIAFVRLGIGTSLALTLYASLLRTGLGAISSMAWMRRAFSLRQLVVIAAALAVGVLLPSHLAYWRWQPASVTAAWYEPTFAILKLAVMFLLANLAWTAVVRMAAREQD